MTSRATHRSSSFTSGADVQQDDVHVAVEEFPDPDQQSHEQQSQQNWHSQHSAHSTHHFQQSQPPQQSHAQNANVHSHQRSRPLWDQRSQGNQQLSDLNHARNSPRTPQNQFQTRHAVPTRSYSAAPSYLPSHQSVRTADQASTGGAPRIRRTSLPGNMPSAPSVHIQTHLPSDDPSIGSGSDIAHQPSLDPGDNDDQLDSDGNDDWGMDLNFNDDIFFMVEKMRNSHAAIVKHHLAMELDPYNGDGSNNPANDFGGLNFDKTFQRSFKATTKKYKEIRNEVNVATALMADINNSLLQSQPKGQRSENTHVSTEDKKPAE